jgi:hypothetical protein
LIFGLRRIKMKAANVVIDINTGTAIVYLT